MLGKEWSVTMGGDVELYLYSHIDDYTGSFEICSNRTGCFSTEIPQHKGLKRIRINQNVYYDATYTIRLINLYNCFFLLILSHPNPNDSFSYFRIVYRLGLNIISDFLSDRAIYWT